MASVEPKSESHEARITHPEELKGTVNLSIGGLVSINLTARATPAGLVGVALVVSAIFVPLIWISRSRRHLR